MAETCSCRRIALDSDQDRPYQSLSTTIEIGRRKGGEVTRMVKLYRSRCSISRPTVVPFSLSLYKFSNINHDFFFSSSPPLSSLLQQRSLPDRLLAGHCSKNYLRPLEKWKKERWKSRSSKISREISCISFLEEGIDSYRFINFMKGKERDRAYLYIVILTRIALNRG